MANGEESLYWKINHYIGDTFDKLAENPSNGLLVAMALVLFYLIGIILDWDWTISPPGSGNFMVRWVHSRSRRTIRIFYAIIAIILLLSLGFMYYYYTFK